MYQLRYPFATAGGKMSIKSNNCGIIHTLYHTSYSHVQQLFHMLCISNIPGLMCTYVRTLISKTLRRPVHILPSSGGPALLRVLQDKAQLHVAAGSHSPAPGHCIATATVQCLSATALCFTHAALYINICKWTNYNTDKVPNCVECFGEEMRASKMTLNSKDVMAL